MKNIKLVSLFVVLFLSLVSFSTLEESSKYKCMIQMTNYTGEGAYVVISLINPDGEYEETLYVQGDDDEWYNTVESWWNFYGKKRQNIDAITGATISGGQRAITVIDIEDNKIDTGYKLRFETAVENQEYYTTDVEFELTSDNVKTKIEGQGFIRYIRMLPQNN
ncbi:DUF2271 domain-containing protein [Winogradskyella bathintestinalis]|uniref:DUF2271 domain-containing protein n=1 Tax=Winogradskyella bathintestinalis TaxID=3035208 RepID=A0ABT7ZXD9_9FLAO|nr:DUF2271 domain-containing protein [Winogradskyella bathintestinalis]MDN3493660.1 DUF2271 domain-containing protein [Winogradskyella bathintestinalis]